MAPTPNAKTPIAVVGIGCLLPDAADPSSFWAATTAARSAIRPLRGGPWQWERLPLSSPPRGGQVEGFTPDWRAFRLPPADAASMNPMQLHVLEAGRQALGGLRALPRERTGIWIGATGLGWRPDTGLRVRLDALCDAVRSAASAAGVEGEALRGALADARASLDGRLRPANEEPVVNSAASIAAGRLAMLFDLRGPHGAVDAGFASGLASLDVACRALREGTVDCAVAGGASELLSPAEVTALDRMGVLSRDVPRPFDAEADGTVPGEGAALFALKRLEDAVRDGEQVHAVVLGIGAACDAPTGSVLSPRSDGQALAIRRALSAAAVHPGTIGFVECHATGTPRGDAAELAALGEAFANVAEPVAIGSAKATVGHLRGAAGAVGLLRAVLALANETVPPQAGFSTPGGALRDHAGRFVVPTSPQPLRARGGAARARAAVGAASLGGIAYHAVLEARAPVAAAPVPARAAQRAGRGEPIAVIGLGGVFPGAPSVPQLWESLLDGRDAIREIPPERWDAATYCDPDPRRLERSYTKLGCFAAPPEPDPGWRIPPAGVGAVDPAHLLALRAAEEAVADAGLGGPGWDRDRTGTFLGYMACQGRKLLAEMPFHLAVLAAELGPALRARGVPAREVDALLTEASRRLQAGLPPATEDALAGWLGSVAAARIARRFGLRGPQLAVESACASTLAALGAAAAALRDGTCDTALAGGLWGDMQPEFYVGSCRFAALSATGSTPFDARADGFVPGEGAGILVLRRLSDAERDGHRIHALVREVAASSDGRGKSVLAPSAEGEALAMRRALEGAGVDPRLVDYVECHGTGTALGDATEVEALTRAYGRGRARPLRVGSVKSNLGHLLAAAAAPALVKAVLAVREGVLPPSLGVERPSPAIDFAAGPIEVVTRTAPWEAPPGEPRRAGVSGFGLGGTNVHAIVEEYRPAPRAAVSPSPAPPRRARLPIAAAGGRGAAECAARLERLVAEVRGRSDAFHDALARGWDEAARAPYRVAIVASDAGALDAKVALLRRGIADGTDLRLLQSQGIQAAAPGPAPRVAAIFPGQGPQYPNMLREALASFPSLGRTLAEADRAYEARCGRRLTEAFFTDDPGRHVQADEDAHCAVFVVNVALYRLLVRFGLRPAALMGQSAGELAALVAGGAVGFEDGLALVRERTRSVLTIETPDPGSMVALACGAARARRFLEKLPGYAALAADNGPGACIVSTGALALPPLLAFAAAAGVEANVLPVSHGYHSQLIAPARPRYLHHLARVPFRPSRVEIVSTVTGRSLADLPPDRLPEHLATQFVEPVRLAPAVEELYARGVRIFVECGPKRGLSTFVGHILGDRPHVAQATLHPKVGEAEQIHRALAGLFVHGAVTLTENEEDRPMTTHERPTFESAPPTFESAPPTFESAPPTFETAPPTFETAPPTFETAPPTSAESPASSRPDGDLVVLLEGIRDLIDGYLLRARAAAATSPPSRANGHARPLDGQGADALALEMPLPRPSARPQAAPPAATPPPPANDAILAMLLGEYARRTGYPEEMLAPDLDLEAELGIDTVKQVAVLAAVREKLGLAPDPTFKLRDASTIAKATAWLAARAGAAVPPMVARGPAATPAPAAARVPETPSVPAPAPAPIAAPALPAQGDVRGRVRRMLLEEYVRRTGYPEEMLAPDLDLEAELGIDTVKQVAVLAAVREKLGLAPDPAFKLRDASTLDRAVEVLARWCARGGPDGGGPPPSGGGAPRPATDPTNSSSPALGDCAAPPAPARAPARLLAAMLRASDVGAIREISSLALRRSASDRPARDPLVEVVAACPDGGVQLRAVLGDSSAEAKVARGDASSPAPAASPELLAALAPGGRPRPASGEELRATLDPGQAGAAELLGWARSDGFMIATGGAQLRGEDEPARIASILACAGELASYAWHGLTGAPHGTAAVERARFHAVPADGADIAFHAKMVPPEGGLWRADVQVVCDRRVVAEIRGLAGIPTAASATAGPAAESAARAWRRLTRRLSGDRTEEVA